MQNQFVLFVNRDASENLVSHQTCEKEQVALKSHTVTPQLGKLATSKYSYPPPCLAETVDVTDASRDIRHAETIYEIRGTTVRPLSSPQRAEVSLQDRAHSSIETSPRYHAADLGHHCFIPGAEPLWGISAHMVAGKPEHVVSAKTEGTRSR